MSALPPRTPEARAPEARTSGLYRTIWRWHFYAGLFVIPFVLILSLTGALYLFKPQIERWEERAFRHMDAVRPDAGKMVSADGQRAAALAAFPGARLVHYRLPEHPGEPALLHLSLSGGATRDVFVGGDGTVRGSLDPDRRIIAIDRDIHGQLLLGPRGSWLVELAASWAIVMILSGLYLWWPRGRQRLRIAGVLWPRLHARGRLFWRDLHAVTGVWVSLLALILLVTGLPWTTVWGGAFKALRMELGLIAAQQDWTIGGQGAGHDGHAATTETRHQSQGSGTIMPGPAPSLSRMVERAQQANLAFPVLVEPPSPRQADWVIKSDSQNRPLRIVMRFDAKSGAMLARETFADRHAIDRVIGYGIAWHEGQLFGWVNQAVGVVTAFALVMMSVSGFILWRRRKPLHGIGAPAPARNARARGVLLLVCGLALVLPMLALSLVAVLLFDRMILPRAPQLARWLGMAA